MATARKHTAAGNNAENPRKTRAVRKSGYRGDDESIAQHGLVEAARNDLSKKVALAVERITPEEIIAETVLSLRKGADELIARMLGMENRWGKWEVDHCNGRMSNITAVIDSAAKFEVNKFLEEHVNMEQIKKSITRPMISTITKNYKTRFDDELHNQLYRMIDEAAKDHAAEIAKELRDELRKQCSTGEVTDR